MTRRDKVQIAQAMRAAGLTNRQIAEEFGISRFTVRSWFNDPDRAKQKRRRTRYAGKCVDCGKPTDGSNGYGKASKRCSACALERSRQLTDADLAYAKREYESGTGCDTIAAKIGVGAETVNRNLQRIGVRIRPHHRGSWTRVDVADAVRRYEAGESAWSIGLDYGDVGGSTVRFQLEGAGVKIRTRSEANQLRHARRKV